ncbi:excisionase family DNA binding protein [Knoellia remsis]|uniref:Excisionase family DNA binding protein n=1 Tax=Knoellia remsis TaxID=407159 RepID=A0A2T0U7Y2_9MICO|nr:helix-turn-helix domain-containing protein [Knoellia remsis]PRY54009.1 excisionase family DNA binding protein [Knoellia remsis]
MSRTRTAAVSAPHTYIANDREDAQILDIVRALEAAGGRAPKVTPSLVAADGTRLELPPAMFAVLKQVAEALADGMGVSVAPLNALLTTQEAADYLGISRPTLVRMLERGDLPMEKPGRHRFVRLSDLVEFQKQQRADRRHTLAEMQRQGQEDGLYDATDGPPPRTR